MTQLVLNIEDPKAAAALEKIISMMNGISISKPKRKTSYERACEDIDAGRITYCESVEDMFDKLNS